MVSLLSCLMSSSAKVDSFASLLGPGECASLRYWCRCLIRPDYRYRDNRVALRTNDMLDRLYDKGMTRLCVRYLVLSMRISVPKPVAPMRPYPLYAGVHLQGLW
jgi:hypothetical protein